MKINILLPYKEKFDMNETSSVSITVRNNMAHSIYLNQIKVFGQNVKTPLFKDNFVGLKYSILSLKSKNIFLAKEMLKIISKDTETRHLLEIHNRPYLVEEVTKGNKFPVSLFFHNDPLTMRGSKSIKEREKILRKCTAIFCVSEFIKKKFLEGIKIDKKKVHVLYNGVDTKLKKIPLKKNEILFVGRLVFEKGADLYVDVIKSIAQDNPTWSFGLLGSSNTKNKNTYASEVIRKLKSVGVQAKFYGFKNQKFVKEKMKNASIIVIPSLCEEAFGLVAAEAMSNGMAIIASKVGGIPEIVKNNGILIEEIDFIKLRNALLDLIHNRHKREMLQKNAWLNFVHSSKKSSKNLDNFRQIIFQNFY